MRMGMVRKVGWQVDEEVNRDKTGEADGMNLVFLEICVHIIYSIYIEILGFRRLRIQYY